MKKTIAFLLVMVLISSLVPAFAAEGEIELYEYYAAETLPQIYIETENGIALDDDSLIDPDRKTGTMGELNTYQYANATVSVQDCEGYEFEEASARVKIRGNYTANNPKHPLRINFAEAQAMCGLNDGNAMKNWVLLAESGDSSMLKNSVIFYIANSLYSTTGNYASDFRNVEVYINGEYYGVYVLAEQQQVNKYRIDIAQTEKPEGYDSEDITEEEIEARTDVHTGYLIEYDGYYFNEDESITFTIRYDEVTRPNGQKFLPSSAANGTRESEDSGNSSASGENRGRFGGWGSSTYGDTRETGFTIKSDVETEEQHDFIQKVMQTIWDVLYDAAYTDHSDLEMNPYHTMDADGNYVADSSITTAYDAVASVVDIDSLVDMYILQEIGQDGDLDWSSQYYSIDMSSEGNHLLTYTAPWDFDGAFSGSTDSLFVMNDDNPWFVIFYYQDWFWELLNERWDAATEAGVFTGVVEMMDTVTEVNAEAYDRNSERWPGNSGPRASGEANSEQSANAHVRAEESLRSWLETKIASLDRLIDGMVSQQTGNAGQ